MRSSSGSPNVVEAKRSVASGVIPVRPFPNTTSAVHASPPRPHSPAITGRPVASGHSQQIAPPIPPPNATPITPFGPIYSLQSKSSSSDEDPTDILTNLQILDLSTERVNELRRQVGKLQSVQHCEDIEMRLEELLHVVRQRKVSG
jgi:hypothetical protein